MSFVFSKIECGDDNLQVLCQFLQWLVQLAELVQVAWCQNNKRYRFDFLRTHTIHTPLSTFCTLKLWKAALQMEATVTGKTSQGFGGLVQPLCPY